MSSYWLRFGLNRSLRTWFVTSCWQTVVLTRKEVINSQTSFPLLSLQNTLNNSQLIWLVSNPYLFQLVSLGLLAHRPFRPSGFPPVFPRPLTPVIFAFEIHPCLKKLFLEVTILITTRFCGHGPRSCNVVTWRVCIFSHPLPPDTFKSGLCKTYYTWCSVREYSHF